MTEQTMLRVVFFDAAGTLFEPREPVGESYARIAREFGVVAAATQVSAAFRHVFHRTPGLAFGPERTAAELRRLERQWWHGVVAQVFAGLGRFDDFEAYFATLFAFFADSAHWRADPEAAPLLADLKGRGLKLGVISNFDTRLYAILKGLELSPYFNSITISSEAGYAKPAPEIFRTALERNFAQATQALHVGDSEPLDVAGAQAAGIAAVLIDRDAGERWAVTGRVARVSALAAITDAMQKIPFP
ncbi:MAG: HAD-IA family hydrolase [Candidatus Binataceae bacterium]